MKRLFILCTMSLLTVSVAVKTFGKTAKEIAPVVKTIQLSTGVQLEYVEQGSSKGIPVILLHGFTDSWKSFEAVLPHLSSSFHVFSISQRGHGGSSKTQKNYGPEDFAKDITAFIQQMKLEPSVIVGHSMGSINAQCFAANYPSLTKALVLVGSLANFNKPVIDEFRKTISELNDPVDSAFIAEFQKSTIVKPITDEMLNGFIGESRKLPAHVWKGVATGWEKADYTKALQLFSKPALIVWGEKDAYCPIEDQKLLNKTLKYSKLLVYEGIGHAIHWEDPERFAKDLTDFIIRLK